MESSLLPFTLRLHTPEGVEFWVSLNVVEKVHPRKGGTTVGVCNKFNESEFLVSLFLDE